jgi:methylase of polypeptide subunit release factors
VGRDTESRLRAYLGVLEHLRAANYAFVTPTPATHARVIAQRSTARDLRDVFGWSLPFPEHLLEPDMLDLLQRVDALERLPGGALRSGLRVSSLEGELFLHSSYPTTQPDAVFFGPDSYRFAAFLRAELPRFARFAHLVDLGAGSGVGAVTALRMLPVARVTFTDINDKAFELAQANFHHAGDRRGFASLRDYYFLTRSGLDDVDAADCIIANPPYIADPLHRAYRDGGALYGGEVSVHWARQAAAHLPRGGAFLLYTGAAVVEGAHLIEAPLRAALAGFDIAYRELDPDVFGEELERADYAGVERIAVVGLIAVKR